MQADADNVEIGSITAAVVLLDRWIAHAHELAIENERLRVRLQRAREQIEYADAQAKNFQALAAHWERAAKVPF